MVRKSRRDEDDKDDKLSMDGVFLEAGELVIRAGDMLEEIGPRASELSEEDALILLSLSLALDAHIRALRYRYAVVGRK